MTLHYVAVLWKDQQYRLIVDSSSIKGDIDTRVHSYVWLHKSTQRKSVYRYQNTWHLHSTLYILIFPSIWPTRCLSRVALAAAAHTPTSIPMSGKRWSSMGTTWQGCSHLQLPYTILSHIQWKTRAMFRAGLRRRSRLSVTQKEVVNYMGR